MAQKQSGVVVPQRIKWHGRLLAGLIYLIIRAVAGTIKFKIPPESARVLDSIQGNLIVAVWHNRLALALPVYSRVFRPRTGAKGMAALVSASRDGALLARVLEHFGAQGVRGSSSRRGAQAMLELCSLAREGFDIALTPDGPRGPAYVAQEGIIGLGQMTQLPILPASINLSRKICLKSWDKFQIPMPFSYCELVFGEAMRVPAELTTEEREVLRKEFENRLNALMKDDLP